MNKRVEAAINDQIKKEASSSQYYLAMASWAENNGLNGTAKFMYTHSDEERFHMLKLVKFVNERGGTAIIPSIDQPPVKFNDLKNVFELLLEHEIGVTASINNLVDICLQEKDYTTHNFVQWEQERNKHTRTRLQIDASQTAKQLSRGYVRSLTSGGEGLSGGSVDCAPLFLFVCTDALPLL